MYDDLALLLLGSMGLRFWGVQSAELEMRQIRVRPGPCCFGFFVILLV